jgi:uncharacterized protein (DUF433 family)/DNA-binding transcriptional MerR regulator
MVAVKSNPAHLGVGLYSVAEAARLLGVHPATIHRWLDPAEGLVARCFEASEHTISFLELMELHFINLFRGEGVPLAAIRKASAATAKKFGTAYPFCIKRFDTDGKTVFATLLNEKSNQVMVEDLRHGQLVFEQIVKPFFRKIEYDKSIEPSRYWPREKSGRIVLDPTRRFGKPIEAETGIPTRMLYEALLAGGGQDANTVADWLGISVAAVQAAAEFERSLAV